jgi:hypothetical protein
MAPPSPSGDYLDFELSIWAKGNRVETLLLRVGDAMLRGNSRVRGPLSIEERTLQEFGHSVFDIVFRQAQPIAVNYAQSQDKAAERKASGLRLSLRIQEPEVAQRKQVSRAVVEHCAGSVAPDDVGLLSTSNGMVRGRLKSLESGVYRLPVTGDDTVDPVSDLFTVCDRATR